MERGTAKPGQGCVYRTARGGVCTYKRPSGYFQLDRIHAVDAGEGGIEALSIVLSKTAIPTGKATDGYVSLRAPPKGTLYTVLQRYVITHSWASDAVVDNRMASDLGF